MAIKTTGSIDKTLYILFIVVSFIYLLIILSERFFKKFMNDKSHRVIFLWYAIGWSKSPYWWLIFILIIFLILDIVANRKLKLIVSEKIIDYPSFPKRQIEWNELTNLILKDGLVTLDFKNNKIIQQPILNSDIDEKEFNDYCKSKIFPNESFGQIENCPQHSKSKL
jgi:hypothetical protein